MDNLDRLAEILLTFHLMSVVGAPDGTTVVRTCDYYPPTAVYERSHGGFEIQDGHELILIPAGNVRQARDPDETRFRVCEGNDRPALVFVPHATANGSSQPGY